MNNWISNDQATVWCKYPGCRTIAFVAFILFGLAACGGSVSGGGAGVGTLRPPPPPVLMETVADVTSRDNFLGKQGKGYAHVCPGAPSGNDPRSFLIVVNGFSANSVDRQPATGELESVCDGHDTSANYHLVQTRWSTGADYIQRNAGFIRELIETINEKYEIKTDDRLAIVGLSMGGLVSRYALQSMESEGVAHNIDLFVSVDSPQQGAYVPIGVQHIAKLFKDDGAQPMLDILDTPATRQMLLYHYTQGNNAQTWTDDHQTLFIDDLQGILGGFVRTEGMRTVAVSSGRIDGMLEHPKPGVRYFGGDVTRSRDFSFSRTVGSFACKTALNFDIDVDIYVIPQAWSLGLAAGGAGNLQRVATSDVTATANGININDRKKLIDHFQADAKNQLGFGCSLAATRSVVEKIVVKVIAKAKKKAGPEIAKYNNKVFSVPPSTMVSEGVPAGLSDHIGQLRSTMKDNGFRLYALDPAVQNKDTNAFIPVSSALMLSGVGPTDSMTVEMLEAASPFDKVYIEPAENLDHLATTTDWFGKEVTALFDAP